MINRRTFLDLAALSSAAIAVNSACSQAQQTWPELDFTPKFSGEITRLAIINDAAVLGLQDSTLPDLVRRALMGEPGLPNVLGMGIMFPVGRAVVSFLSKARASWLNSGADDDEYRVAIAAGYLMHRAADQRIQEGLLASGITDNELDAAKRLQDAEVIRSYLSRSPRTLAEAEDLLFAIDQKLRIQIHTLRPDGTNEADWVMQLLEWDAAQEALFKQLAATIAEPNADEQRRYVESLNFFNRTDPLIQAARQQNAVEPLETEITPQSSLYGLALNDCRQVIALVSQFVQGNINSEQFAQALTPIGSAV